MSWVQISPEATHFSLKNEPLQVSHVVLPILSFEVSIVEVLHTDYMYDV